jgi:translation initiation factor 1A
MVKNTTGGSKTKGQGRKFITAKSNNALRLSHDESELYAQVTKVLGGAMCHVVCIDDKTRLCHIRGKFRGRGKRDNFVGNGTWILVGLREWEAGKSSSSDKLENCDLLEVYNELDKDRLKSTVINVNWNNFIVNDNKNSKTTDESSNLFEFSDEKTEEYRQLIDAQVTESRAGNLAIISDDGELINVDDI